MKKSSIKVRKDIHKISKIQIMLNKDGTKARAGTKGPFNIEIPKEVVSVSKPRVVVIRTSHEDSSRVKQQIDEEEALETNTKRKSEDLQNDQNTV